MRRLVLDRFEGAYALFENDDEKTFAIAANELPAGAKEGDVIAISDEGELSIDVEETQRRKKQMVELKNKTLKKKKR